MTEHATIASMIETVAKVSTLAFEMGYDAADSGQPFHSNPFQFVKDRYYPQSLLEAWNAGFSDRMNHTND